jgi:hypothetical protein
MSSHNPATAQAREMKESATQEFESIKNEASRKSHDTLQSVKSEARQALTEAREAGGRIITDQKTALVQKVHEYEQAIHAAAETLRNEKESILAEPAERVARQLGQICDYLEHREPMDLLHEVESLARRRPELVFGGLFVAGFAISRFLKSSRHPRSSSVGTVHAGRVYSGSAVPLTRDASLARPSGMPSGFGAGSGSTGGEGTYGQPGAGGQQMGVGLTPSLTSQPSTDQPTINRPSV